MVYYNIENNSPISPSKSASRSPYIPLQAVDKRSVYSCLKKMTGEMNRQPSLQLRCVEQASTLKEDIKSFHKWLEKEVYVVFTEEEVRGLLDYILLHSWGTVIIKDATFLSKLFEVPTPLNYSSWYSNIDNMQIRSQMRNSLMRRPEKKAGVGGGYQPNQIQLPNTSQNSNRIIIPSEKTKEKEEKDPLSKESSKLEQLQQKYLNRSNATSTLYLTSTLTPTCSTTYISPGSRRVPQNRVSLLPLAETKSPVPKLVVLSKQKNLSTQSLSKTQTPCKRYGAGGLQTLDMTSPVHRDRHRKSSQHGNYDINHTNTNNSTNTAKKTDRKYNHNHNHGGQHGNKEYSSAIYHFDEEDSETHTSAGISDMITITATATASPLKEAARNRRGGPSSNNSTDSFLAPRVLPPSPIRMAQKYYQSPTPAYSHSHSQDRDRDVGADSSGWVDSPIHIHHPGQGQGQGADSCSNSCSPSIMGSPLLPQERPTGSTHTHTYAHARIGQRTEIETETEIQRNKNKNKGRSMIIQIPRVPGIYNEL